jgi:hypothetical protein
MGLQASSTDEHRYQLCRDESCQRFACRVYREGYADGRDAGRVEGYAEGFAEGYAQAAADRR